MEMITPRVGIHDHRSPSSQTSEGRDEVDNVMSKLTTNDHRHRSPSKQSSEGSDEDYNIMSKLTNKLRVATNRRTCYMFRAEGDVQVEDESLFAKSLPTSINFMSHFSFDPEEFQNYTLDVHKRKLTFSESSDTSEESIANISIPRETLRYDRKSSSNLTYLLIALAVSVAGLAFLFSHRKIERTVLYNDDYLNREMKQHVLKYNMNPESLLKLLIGVNGISDSGSTGSFMFLYNSKNGGFDENRLSDFVKGTASITAKYLRHNDSVVPLSLGDTCWGRLQTHNELMNKYKETVAANGVMVVKDVDLIPANLAMAFHYYCDEFDPLIKRSAVFSTIDVAGCENNDVTTKSSHVIVENCLIKKWHSIPDDLIYPLLTRLVSIVIDTKEDISTSHGKAIDQE